MTRESDTRRFADTLHEMEGDTEMKFSGYLLPSTPETADLQAVVDDYETVCYQNILAVVERFERHEGAYPFIDTKLDLQSGQDFDARDVVRGQDTIYGWIQGRGLEALAGHARWAQSSDRPEVQQLAPRLRAMERAVLDSVQRLRQANEGQLFFFMTPEGQPFTIGAGDTRSPLTTADPRPSGYSDLFGAKGLFAAARDLGDSGIEAEAVEWMQQVTDDVFSRRFTSDQQPLDPTNPIEAVPGRHAHGAYMIQLGACALGATAGQAKAIETGLQLIQHEITTHANINGRLAEFEEGDFWEFVGDDDKPQVNDDGSVLCDPGHALEFVGLAYKFLRAARSSGVASTAQLEQLQRAADPLPVILENIFALGFCPDPGGICKAFDLIHRRPLHTDMPWWSLPETIRAAALCWCESDSEQVQSNCLEIWRDCHNAFVENYLRPDVHYMAIQTLAGDGTVSDAIPATADADPGYHTGLSLLDVVELFEG